MEQTLVILKPDAINRGVMGEVIHRFEAKGLKIVAMRMEHLQDDKLEEHYHHHRNKPFFDSLKKFMRSAPSLLMVIEGKNAVDVVRKMAGVTHGIDAEPGTIRGDYSLSVQQNIIHASDSIETSRSEISRFFSKDQIHSYRRIDFEMVYAEDER